MFNDPLRFTLHTHCRDMLKTYRRETGVNASVIACYQRAAELHTRLGAHLHRAAPGPANAAQANATQAKAAQEADAARNDADVVDLRHVHPRAIHPEIHRPPLAAARDAAA